ncbi:activating signal cointegrator 1 complex subunit 2 [Trichoderma reesei RUT C-30]|uniref:Activating signal cointegrator 1 complex subunit 2 n=1 Tax=Hypocrea jecorina (strain ATCC 56765 / BCRC 32924 / NRRL 11460 / Rut C-30) TaxID=1344414 RepID=A0A024SAT0_HYPJR|nr:activating signal cointegrator 1 complex subunit 2 [Trichoderma reesei RUT C-30]
MSSSLPPFAPFPKASWRQHISPDEWEALSEAWIALSQAYLDLDDAAFKKEATDDSSLTTFVSTFAEEAAAAESDAKTTTIASSSPRLLKTIFRLASRILTASPPPRLLDARFLAGLCRIFPKNHTAPLLARLFSSSHAAAAVESSLLSLKKLLIPHLDAGSKGDLKLVERELTQLNPLLHASPDACMLLLAGSDFFDGLVTCFRVVNPPLRKAIITTVYLCLVGLTEVEPPKWSMISDQLYAIQVAAEAHRKGPLNANDSLGADLVTNTPILKTLLRKVESSTSAPSNIKNRITALESFKTGIIVRPKKKLVKRKLDKGKGREAPEDVHAEMHVHQMSRIAHVQDLFPDLGAGFIVKCLDEYHDDVEQVIANLIDETLPPHLATADRSEPLSHTQPDIKPHKDLAPRSTPPQLPTRRNVFDDDEFDRLAIDTSKLSFGKKNPDKTADDVLRDKSTAPNKAAILSALAALDPDDDERDDTYDAADVGGTVDAGSSGQDEAADANEELLFRAFQGHGGVFGRDAETRRSGARAKLRDETGMADEAIEGWALMLQRNPAQMKRLEAKYAWSGQQAQLERTSWRAATAAAAAAAAAAAGSGAEESSDPDGGSAGRGGSRGGRARGGGGGGGGGGGRGNVAGPTGEKETEAAKRNKEAHKGARANHNRRDARAKKMARGGFAG